MALEYFTNKLWPAPLSCVKNGLTFKVLVKTAAGWLGPPVFANTVFALNSQSQLLIVRFLKSEQFVCVEVLWPSQPNEQVKFCLFWDFTAQSTHWGHAEHDQFT